MKIIKYILLALLTCALTACTEKSLDIPPMNVVQNKDIFSSEQGVMSYIARLYSELPIEDFRYTQNYLFNYWWTVFSPNGNTGEALVRDIGGSITEKVGYWADAYILIREVNYFKETLPQYSSNFSEDQINKWLGEVAFVRGVTYFALAKRYGGVPIVNKVLQYPAESIDSLKIPRSSEEETYDQIVKDLDFAFDNLPETNQRGRANKNVAAAFKSRAMLFAGCIAKYNQSSLFDTDKKRLCGIPAEKAATYFKLSYASSKKLEGKYSLYMTEWKDGDKEAQYQNYVNLFFANNSPENIFVKYYHYPESSHAYDCYNVPRQWMGGNGYSSSTCPTLNFVEMFDGLPKNAKGQLENFDENGKYKLYGRTMDLFVDAEPRLRATVILPGDEFKGTSIEIRRGIYTAKNIEGGISRILPEGSTANYPTKDIVTSSSQAQTPYKLYDGREMNPCGLSGMFASDRTCSITGFSIRKYLNSNMPNALEWFSDQDWIEMRYAEVLLNRAEAAYELYALGERDIDYMEDAYICINLLRKRAGATMLTNKSDLNSIDIVRKERRKELCFENKTWWDMKRWRIIDKEHNATMYRILLPFYVEYAGKYFFDVRFDETKKLFTFDARWYYQQLPTAEITKSPNLIQNPGY